MVDQKTKAKVRERRKELTQKKEVTMMEMKMMEILFLGCCIGFSIGLGVSQLLIYRAKKKVKQKLAKTLTNALTLTTPYNNFILFQKTLSEFTEQYPTSRRITTDDLEEILTEQL